jgi:hypothetical protein
MVALPSAERSSCREEAPTEATEVVEGILSSAAILTSIHSCPSDTSSTIKRVAAATDRAISVREEVGTI